MKLRLKECRIAAGKTQSDIAQIIGITRAAYSNIETGKREPDFKSVNTLADYFNVSVDYLLGREDIQKRPATVTDDEPMSPLDSRLIEIIRQLTPENKRKLADQLEFLLHFQEQPPDSRQ